jgi:hypothetical protein
LDNNALSAEEGEEENATGMGFRKIEGRTAKFEIIDLSLGLVAT